MYLNDIVSHNVLHITFNINFNFSPYDMKTRKSIKPRKSKCTMKFRKMKGGMIMYNNETNMWYASPTNSRGQPLGAEALSYSNAEAAFLNKLGVRSEGSNGWFDDPASANWYLQHLAGDILHDDVSIQTFNDGMHKMESAIASLRSAYDKRRESDEAIKRMSPEEKKAKNIDDSAISGHEARTSLLKNMLDSIKVFMEPYYDKQKSFHVTTPDKPTPPPPSFNMLRLASDDSTKSNSPPASPKGPFQSSQGPFQSSKGPFQSSKGSFQSLQASQEFPGSFHLQASQEFPGSFQSTLPSAKATVNTSSRYVVSTFRDCPREKPTSLCFTNTKLIIGVLDGFTIMDTDDPSRLGFQPIRPRISCPSFCDFKNDKLLLSYGGDAYLLDVTDHVESEQETLGVKFGLIKAYDDVLYKYTGVSMHDYKGELKTSCMGCSRVEGRFINFVTRCDENFSGYRTDMGELNDAMGICCYPTNPMSCIIADSGNNRIVIVDIIETVDRKGTHTLKHLTIIGGGEGGSKNKPGLKDGKGIHARFNNPTNVLKLPDDSIIVSDTGNHCIRRIHMDENGDWNTETIAGAGNGSNGYNDGRGNQALFYEPHGLCLKDGVIYVADTNNARIRQLILDTEPVPETVPETSKSVPKSGPKSKKNKHKPRS